MPVNGYVSLIAACALFVGKHFLLSHVLRERLVARLGLNAYLGLYSLLSFGLGAWMLWAFWMAPSGIPLWEGGAIAWWVATVLTLLASILMAGSFAGNPALPGASQTAVAAASVGGVFGITRHPMMWGTALWAISHMLVAPSAAILILMGSLAFLALAGSAGQDRRKADELGEAWQQWAAKTSFWPRLSGLSRAGWLPWSVGLFLWLVAQWAHMPLGGFGAGVFR
jgi:uncharacterized membrane protein